MSGEEMKTKIKAKTGKQPEVVTQSEWLVARKDLLSRETEFIRQRDA